jgi:predicted metal-binding membrane protein
VPIDGSRQLFLAVSAVLFVASVALTVFVGASMSGMGTMAMHGGWTMTMVWMRMPGQTWLGSAAAFVGMWTSMMVAMMLPSLVPALGRYRNAISISRTGGMPLGPLTVIAGFAYYAAWTVAGFVVFTLGVVVASVEMQQPVLARASPVAAGVIVLLTGVLQFSSWKSRHLTCCRQAPDDEASTGTGSAAWRYGLRLGWHCICCCAGLTSVLLVAGVMDLKAMAIVGAAITIERLAPHGKRVTHVIGFLLGGAGLVLLARAAQLG